MYAIIESCGKQYKVSEGDVVFFEKLDAEEGKKVTFDKVVLVSDEGKVQVGNPYVKSMKVEGKVVSTCTCVIIPNLTHNQRPYEVVENVVTDQNFRGKGYATLCLDFAKEIAIKNNCYKLMLMTGSKKEATLNFYRNAGYTDKTKTAFDQRV